jgi:hypothetical protein
MEQVIIEDCGCITLSESVVAAFDLRRGMTLDVVLNDTGDAILLTPHRGDPTSQGDACPQRTPTSSCVILPPSR